MVTSDSNSTRPRLLHLVANYPDGVSPGPKTTAVKHLLDYASDLDHLVVSLTRVLKPWQESVMWQDDMLVVQYFALPRAVMHATFMRRVAARIDQALAQRDVTFELVHAHKVSTEGFIADYMASARDLPRIYSVRPYTDFKLFTQSAALRETGCRLLENASAVVVLAPWAQRRLAQIMGKNLTREAVTIANAVVNSSPVEAISTTASEQRFVTVFRADQYKAKGFDRVLKAMGQMPETEAHIGIDVFGGGDLKALQKVVDLAGMSARVRLRGRVDNAELVTKFSQYLGLVMPSERETFGMVFAEALCSGIPVIYAKDSSIDGFFDAQTVGAAVVPSDVAGLAAAMTRLTQNNEAYRTWIRELRAAGQFDIFLPAEIKARYENLVSGLLSS